jgi:type II secretory pathway component PulM
MSVLSPVTDFWARLSQRERTLLAACAAVALVAGGLTFGLRPGIDAVSSAEDRRRRAAIELHEVRVLAAELANRRQITQTDLSAAFAEAAAQTQVRVIEQAQQGEGVLVRVAAPSSAAALAFAPVVSKRAGLAASSLQLAHGEDGEVAASFVFTRGAP